MRYSNMNTHLRMRPIERNNVMTTDERINKIEARLDEHEDKINCLEKKQMSDRFELSNLITEAVNKGLKPLMEKQEEQGKRITVLENAEAQKALEKNKEVWKTIRSIILSIVVTFFVTVLLNNLISIIAATQTPTIEQGEVK